MDTKSNNMNPSTNANPTSLESLMPIIPNFPKPGVNFRDISPLLRDVKMRNWVFEELAHHFLTTPIDVVLGIESRGFLIGFLLADRLGVPFVMGRKPSSLPGKVEKIVYDLEYATACLEIQTEAIKEGQKVLIVDDILATGGTMLAASSLIKKMGAQVSGLCCVVELPGFGGQDRLKEKLGMTCHCLEIFQPLPTNNSQPINTSLSKSPYILPNVNLKNGSWQDLPRSKLILLYHPSMLGLAKRLYNSYPDLFELETISWESFPDGYANVHFPPNLARRRIVFLASLFDKHTYMDQLSVMMVLPRQGIQSLDIILPYYAPGTMERVETAGTLATADTYAQITSCCFPPTIEGPPTFFVFDLHNNTTRFSFSNHVRFWPMSAVPQVLQEMSLMCGNRPYAVAFPDEGSWKRFRGLMPPDQPVILCGKMRDGDKRVVRIMEVLPLHIKLENIDHVLIVDDLVQSGGTLRECYLALKKLGIKRVSAYVTHAVFPQRAYLPFFDQGKWGGFENFWITDSIPKHADLLKGHSPFRVISLSNPIVTDLTQRYFPSYVPELKVAITSKNLDKINAVQSAMQQLFPNHTISIYTAAVDSKIPSQPIGIQETTEGAQNRLNSFYKTLPVLHHTFDFVISLENGVNPDKLEDFGVVVVKNAWKKQQITLTEKVKIDQEVWDEYNQTKSQNPDLTCGLVYKALKGYDSSNWHLPVCGKSRIYLLTEAIIRAVETM